MAEKIEFSFLIAAYNEKKLIGPALNNITKRINESGIDSEILISIKGNDGTKEIAESYARKFKSARISIFNQTMGKSEAIDFLIGKASGDIIINFDADKLLTANLKNIKSAFKKGNVGGIVSIDSLNPELYFNDGQMIFEKTYEQIKLKKYLKHNYITNPIFSCFIFRKSALKKPYIESYGDDFEITWKLIHAKYKVMFSKKLSYCLIDNPIEPKHTVASIIKRRFRAEVFRGQAKSLNVKEFSTKERISEFCYAILLTLKRANMKQRAEFLEYMAVVFFAVVAAKIKILFQGDLDRDYQKATSVRES